MMVTLLYRFVLGVLLATLNEWVPGPLVFLGVNAALLTYISYCEPFHDIWQNRRSLLVHLTHFVILFVCLYYRFESANNPIESNNLNVPAVIELASIGLCIVVSIGMLVR